MVSWLNCAVKQLATVECTDIASFAEYSLFLSYSDFSYPSFQNARTNHQYQRFTGNRRFGIDSRDRGEVRRRLLPSGSGWADRGFSGRSSQRPNALGRDFCNDFRQRPRLLGPGCCEYAHRWIFRKIVESRRRDSDFGQSQPSSLYWDETV
jgi:hypothetical protein